MSCRVFNLEVKVSTHKIRLLTTDNFEPEHASYLLRQTLKHFNGLMFCKLDFRREFLVSV